MKKSALDVAISMACPYDAPQYDAKKGHMTKCDGCYSRIQEGQKPICVTACPLRALDFAQLTNCEKNTVRKHHCAVPSTEMTYPNLVVKANKNARPSGDATGFLANPREVWDERRIT